MKNRVEQLIDTTSTLSLHEQLELVVALSQRLHRHFHSVEKQPSFWKGNSLAELVEEQQVVPKTNIRDYAKDFWPEDETTDDMIAFFHKQRQLDKERDVS